MKGNKSSDSRQVVPYGSGAVVEPEDTVRPRDAVVSCAHLWAILLIIAGVVEIVVGSLVFNDWKSVGAFWVGISALSAGVAGVYVRGAEPSGGPYTVFFMVLAALTLLVSLVSVMMGDGLTYLVVQETGGNCYDASSCAEDACAKLDCVCWVPDGTATCDAEARSTLRYCLRFAGSCSDIGDTESELLGSSVTLLLISVISLFSLLVAVATCFWCKRIILAEPATTNL